MYDLMVMHLDFEQYNNLTFSEDKVNSSTKHKEENVPICYFKTL